MRGVVRTRVGYAGGTTRNPTYYSLGDHSEALQIDYDPTQVSYEELLEAFWDSHDPTRLPWSQQYKAIIFYHNDEQKRLAIETRAREEARLGRQVLTEIVPASDFYPAEAYHQKYWLRHAPDLMHEFRAMYPTDEGFVDSTAVARVNGYLAGHGSISSLQDELNTYGLSPAGSKKLLQTARRILN